MAQYKSLVDHPQGYFLGIQGSCFVPSPLHPSAPSVKGKTFLGVPIKIIFCSGGKTEVLKVRYTANKYAYYKLSDFVAVQSTSSSADGTETPIAAAPTPKKEYINKGMMVGALIGTGVGVSLGMMMGGKNQILMLGSIGLIAGTAIGYGGKK